VAKFACSAVYFRYIVLNLIIIILTRMMMMGLNANKEYYSHRDISFWLFRNLAGICLMRSRVAEKW